MVNFYNPYMTQGNYLQELNNMRDRIDAQIHQVQNQQVPQPTSLTQNFQITPTGPNNNFKLVNNEDEVAKDIVIIPTYYLEKGYNVLWVKDTKGDIRRFEMSEIKKKDEKDLIIENLQKQIDELKGSAINGDTTNDRTNANSETNKSITSTKSSIVPDLPNGKTK